MPLPDGLFGALRDLFADDVTLAGLPMHQGQGPTRATASYVVGRLKSWTPAQVFSDETWYDCRVELRVHDQSEAAAQAGGNVVQASLQAQGVLEWSTGGTGRPLTFTRRRERAKGYTVDGQPACVEVVEAWYKATGTP
jgi:hypothetical protein